MDHLHCFFFIAEYGFKIKWQYVNNDTMFILGNYAYVRDTAT